MKGNVIEPQSTGHESGVMTEKGPASWLGPALVFAGFLLYLCVYCVPPFFSKNLVASALLSKLVWPNILLGFLGLIISIGELIRKKNSFVTAQLLFILALSLIVTKLMIIFEYLYAYVLLANRPFRVNQVELLTWIVNLLVMGSTIVNLLFSKRALRRTQTVTARGGFPEQGFFTGLFLFAVGAVMYLVMFLKASSMPATLLIDAKFYFMMLSLIYAAVTLFQSRVSRVDTRFLLVLAICWLVWDLFDIWAGFFPSSCKKDFISFYISENGGLFINWGAVVFIVAGGVRGFFASRDSKFPVGILPLRFLSLSLLLSGLVLAFSSRYLPAIYLGNDKIYSLLQGLSIFLPSYVFFLWIACAAAGFGLFFVLLFVQRNLKWIMVALLTVSIGFLWVIFTVGHEITAAYSAASVTGPGFFIPLAASLVLLAGAILGLALKKPREASPQS